MPSDAAHVAAHAGDFGFHRLVHIRADLERGMVCDAFARIMHVDFRRGLAETVPRAFQCGVRAIEIPVVAFRIVGDHVGMRFKPVGDQLHVGLVDRMPVVETVARGAILAVKSHDAVERDGNGIKHHAHVGGCAARTDEHLHAIALQCMQRVDGGLRHHMRDETRQRAVDVEKRRLDVLSHAASMKNHVKPGIQLTRICAKTSCTARNTTTKIGKTAGCAYNRQP